MSGERIFRPFLVILAFIILTGFLLISFNHLFTASDSLDIPEVSATLGDWDVTMFTPTDGYEVTNASVRHNVPDGQKGGFEFDSADKRVYVIRDNDVYNSGSPYNAKAWTKYKDFIAIKRKADDLVGGKVFRVAIPLQKIVLNFDHETNISATDFVMSGSNYTLFIKTWDNNTNRIWWNNYTVYLGKGLLKSNHLDFWSAIRMVLFAQIPNCNPIVNVMVSVMVDLSLIFIGIQLAMRIFPLGGGG
jgi:hypothetical protein